jgi:hypothetical protein
LSGFATKGEPQLEAGKVGFKLASGSDLLKGLNSNEGWNGVQ